MILMDKLIISIKDNTSFPSIFSNSLLSNLKSDLPFITRRISTFADIIIF
jgi:hypothetical protein